MLYKVTPLVLAYRKLVAEYNLKVRMGQEEFHSLLENLLLIYTQPLSLLEKKCGRAFSEFLIIEQGSKQVGINRTDCNYHYIFRNSKEEKFSKNSDFGQNFCREKYISRPVDHFKELLGKNVDLNREEVLFVDYLVKEIESARERIIQNSKNLKALQQ